MLKKNNIILCKYSEYTINYIIKVGFSYLPNRNFKKNMEK